MSDDSIVLRRARVSDIDHIVRLGRAMFEDMGITLVTLHATEDGSQIYSQYGFADANQMRVSL